MNYTFQVSDEQYDNLAEYAARWGKTPETLFQEWVQGTADWMELWRSAYKKQANQEDEEEFLDDPLFQLAGVISVKEEDPNWTSKIDEYLAEAYLDNHAGNK